MDPTITLLLVLRNLLATMGALAGTTAVLPGLAAGEHR